MKLLGALRKVRSPQFAPQTTPNDEQNKNLSTHTASPTGEFTTPQTAPNVLKELRNPNDSQDDVNDSRDNTSPTNTFTTPNTSANRPTLKVPNSPTSSFPNVQSPEVARLSAQYEKMNQPKSLKELVANAALSFAPTAIAGAFGGLAGASGAAHGVNAGLAAQSAQEAAQKKSLLEQVEAAKQREERMAEHQLTARTAEQGHIERLKGIEATNSLRDLISQRQTTAGDQRNVTALRKLGLDAQGNPIPREQLTPAEQSKLDLDESLNELRGAQAEHAKAQAEFERVRNDPNSPAFKLAQQRLSLAQSRLDLSRQQTESRLFGTNNGVPLPGALITDSGQTVGSSYSQNVRPTGTERVRGDMASSAREQLSDIVSIVQRHPEVFGPVAGRKTDVSIWMGTQDPDAQAFRAARTIAGDHLAGTFGGRSEPALAALDDAVGRFKDNPAAMLAGIKQLDKAAKVFEDKGAMKTVGSTAGQGKLALKPGDVENGYTYLGGDPKNPLSWKKK